MGLDLTKFFGYKPTATAVVSPSPKVVVKPTLSLKSQIGIPGPVVQPKPSPFSSGAGIPGRPLTGSGSFKNDVVNLFQKTLPNVAESVFNTGISGEKSLANSLVSNTKTGQNITDLWSQILSGTPTKLEKVANKTIDVSNPGTITEQGKGILPKFAQKGPLPFLAGVGLTALDFTGAGGEKGAIKALTEAKDISTASKVLKDIGVTDDLVKEYAPILSKTSKEAEVSKIVNHLGEIQKTTKAPQLAVKTTEVAKPPLLNFNPEKYVAEQVSKAKDAEQVVNTKGKINSFLSLAKRKLVDFAAPIEDVLGKAVKENKLTLKPSEDIHNAIDRVLRSPTIAGQFARDHGLEGVIKNVDNLDHLDQYMIAKQATKVAEGGIKTGRDIEKDKALIGALKDTPAINTKNLKATYEETSKIVSQYSQKLLDYAVESGLIDNKLAETLKTKYPDYVPLNRVFNELEKTSLGFGGGKAVASLSRQTAVQKLVGSEREIQSPIKSLLEKTSDVFKQGEKNKAGQILAGYKDLPGNPFNITPLRTAEDVTKRIDLYSEAKELKPIQNKIGRFISTNAKKIRSLSSELNNLNEKGLRVSLKTKADEELPKLVSKIKTTLIPEAEKVKFGADDRLLSREVKPRVTIVKDIGSAIPAVQDVKKFVNSLVTDPKVNLSLIKKKIATRENKLGPLIDKLQDLKTTFDDVKEHRSSLFDEAKLLRDAESRGKSTITSFKNGIKEIYETDPEIANAAKALNVQQLNVLEKILAFPTRIAKIGITGVNIPFILSNIAKDQVTAFINSSHAFKTSVGNPMVYLDALFNAVGHGKIYAEMAREGAMGTSFDIARNQAVETIEHLRSNRSLATKSKYIVSHPIKSSGDLLRAVENLVGRSEEFTRIKQYSGTKKALLTKGMSESEARIGAARAAREDTVNFARRGEWGQVLNSAFLYLNAGIQGTRTFLRNVKEKPLQSAAKLAIAGFTPMAAATAWNLSDPKRKAAYDDIKKNAEYELQNNIVILPPNPTKDKDGKWNVIKIPLSQEINNIVGIPRQALEQAYSIDPISVMDVLSALTGTLSPINPLDKSAISNLIPQALKPVAQAKYNKNFFTGKDEVPSFMKDLSPDQQAFEDTSGTARGIGGVLGQSPIKIEDFIRDTFGGVGSQVLNASDQALSKTGLIPKEQVGGQNILDAITGRFSKAQGSFIDPKKAKVQPVFDQVQKLKAQGDEAEAQKLVNGLSDVDYETYKAIRSDNNQIVAQKALDAKLAGNQEEAQKLVDQMSDDQYTVYKNLKTKTAEAGDAIDQASKSDTGLVHLISNYAKAFEVDPGSAFKTLFTKEELVKVVNDAVIMKRMSLADSQAVKKRLNATADMRLDHTIPLEIGGSNDESNLKLVDKAVWESYSPVENKLGKLLAAKRISKKEAQRLIKGFKDGSISRDEIMNKN